MKKHILCFGDSNTHGYCADPNDSADGELGRFNEEERWTCLLQQYLGYEYLVIEEGLSGRTTVFDVPLHEGLSGIDYLSPCLRSHSPIDLLIIMLGTNDSKERFSANAYAIGKGMERLILSAKNTDCWAKSEPNILVVCPPPIGEGCFLLQLCSKWGKVLLRSLVSWLRSMEWPAGPLARIFWMQVRGRRLTK